MPRRKRRRPHGMGSVYQRGPGNFWIKWREAGEVRYSRGYATRELAEQVLAKIVADKAAGCAGLPPDPKGVPTLAELTWFPRTPLRVSHPQPGASTGTPPTRERRRSSNGWRACAACSFAMPEPVNVAFAAGALAGLRTGEVLGLEWGDVDLQSRRMLLRQQARHDALGPLKDDESRLVPILSPLVPILAEWKLKTGGTGLLFTPAQPARGGRGGRPGGTFLQIHTLHRHLKAALETCALPSLTWYQATRHTFASQFVLTGSIEKLSKLMGHSSVTTTERYAHLRTDLFRVEDYDRFAVDLRAGIADVVPLKPASEVHPSTIGYVAATQPSEVSPAPSASL